MQEASTIEEGEYAKFYGIDVLGISFEEGVNEIQHLQWSLVEITEGQSKNEVWSKVISWVEKGQWLEKEETRGKAREVW